MRMPNRRADFIQLERSQAAIRRANGFLRADVDPPDATSDQAGVPLPRRDYLIL